MNECLVTKLKSSVNDESLLKIGELKAYLKDGATKEFVSVYSTTKTVLIENAILYNVSEAEINPEQPLISFQGLVSQNGNKNAVIVIGDKYNLTHLVLPELKTDIDVSVFKYSDKLEELSGRNFTGVMNSIVNILPNVKKISLSYSSISTDLSDFRNCKNMTDLNIGWLYEKATGNISSLGSLTNLNNVNFCNTLIYGTLESFVQGQIAAGRATGTITFTWIGATNITYQGNPIANKEKTKVSWTSDGTITLA